MPEHDSPSPRDAAPDRPTGFSTRAIRAAHRAPRVDQRPTSVPIYQTVTFSSDDAAELGAVLTDQQPGYAYSRIDNPTVAALAAAVAELEGAEAGFALASGMAAIHAAVVSLVSAGDRIVATQASYGTTRALFSDILGRLGVTTVYVDMSDEDAVEAALAAAPTRILYAETIANPDDRRGRPRRSRRDRPPPRRPLRRRQHVRVTLSLPAPRAGRRPRHRVRHEVPVRPQRRAGRRRHRSSGPDRRGPNPPARHRRLARAELGVPRAPRHLDARDPHGAALGDGSGTRRVARASGRRVARLPPLARQPSPA